MVERERINRISSFLIYNRWEREDEQGIIHFYKKGNYGIDIDLDGEEVVIIADEGDIAHFSLSAPYLLSTLTGFLVLYPAIGASNRNIKLPQDGA